MCQNNEKHHQYIIGIAYASHPTLPLLT